MIDMHNHILFGVDDGCQTIDESIRMIEKAHDVGVTAMILTPHYAPLRGYVASHDTIQDKFHELKQAIDERAIPVHLYLGREIDEVKDIDALLKEGTVQTMNGTNYVLVDFGMSKTDIDEYCYELIINGYKPIIAHPERYNYIDDEQLYHRWKKTGALLQVNASSLFHPKNKQTKKVIKYLIKHKLIDLIGSDSHRAPKNYDDFAKGYELLEKKGMKIRANSAIFVKEEDIV